MTQVSVVGLGRLGAPFAATIAAAGHRVLGVDTNMVAVESINAGRAPVPEPGLDELIALLGMRLTATREHAEAVATTDVTFIVVPTPSEPDGGFSLEHVLPAIRATGRVLARRESFHLVVLTSTVMPGSTELVRRELEQVAGKRCGVDFGLCYSPEFIALGTVIRDLRNPDFVLIGESDRRSGDLLVELYRTWCENDPPVARMNFVNAEIAKLAVNTFVTTKISYANMLTQVCEHLPGANVDVVTTALGLDSRIGSKYLKGGACYGGPCFPRDNRAFAALAAGVGADARIARATDEQNVAQVDWVAREVQARIAPGERVAVLGLAYKTGTNIAEESHGLKLTRALAEAGFEVVAHDFAATGQARDWLADIAAKVTVTADLSPSLWGCRLAIVATPWGQYKTLLQEMRGRPNRPVVLDCWRLLDAIEGDPTYVPLGVGHRDGMTNARHETKPRRLVAAGGPSAPRKRQAAVR